MFGNFIYFIIVLLVFSTYSPAKAPNFGGLETLLLFFGLLFAYIAAVRILFRNLENRIGRESPVLSDSRLIALQFRLSVAAVVLFLVDIYGLNLTDYLSKVPLLKVVPTLQALLCTGIFALHLAITWNGSHACYAKLFPDPLSRKSYVLSNLSFAVPAIVPWLLLSGVADLLQLLPFEFIPRFLATPAGDLVYTLLAMAAIALLGPALIQKSWRCTPLPPGPVRSRIEALCQSAGVGYRNILQWPIFGGRMITAGVMGLAGRFRYFLVTRALLQHLSGEELDAVIAHEIGHVRKKHLFFYIFFFIGYTVIVYSLLDVFMSALLFSKPGIFLFINSGYSMGELLPILNSSIMILFFVIYFRYFFGYFMRNFERQADAFVFSMFETGTPLATTLRKIAWASGQNTEKPNWHHFGIGERIRFLERCEEDRSLVKQHDRKMTRSIVLFSFFILLVGSLGYAINFGTAGEKIGKGLMADIPIEEIRPTVETAPLLETLGNRHFAAKAYDKAIAAYERALLVPLAQPEVLNNLAWLYATCEDASFRNPKRALDLAKIATALAPTAEFFDTLAESHYVNGNREEAVAAEEKALSLAQDKGYFESQLKKFRTRYSP